MSKIAENIKIREKEQGRVVSQQTDKGFIFRQQFFFYILNTGTFCVFAFLGYYTVFHYLVYKCIKEFSVGSLSPFQQLGFAILSSTISFFGGPLIGFAVALVLISFLSRHIGVLKAVPGKSKIAVLSLIQVATLLYIGVGLYSQLTK